MERDLDGAPQPGWNYCNVWGPIYLFQEKRVQGYGKNGLDWKDSVGNVMPVDGHFMELANGRGCYAATRAWNWQHGFDEVKAEAALADLAYKAVLRQAAADRGQKWEKKMKM